MSSAKRSDKKPANTARWKDAVNYDIRAKARNWLRFLKRDTAIVTPEERDSVVKSGFDIRSTRLSQKRYRVKAVGVQAVVQALRMKEDVQKVVHAIKGGDWASVVKMVQPLGLPVDYTCKQLH